MGGRRLDIDVPNCAGIYRRRSALYTSSPGYSHVQLKLSPGMDAQKSKIAVRNRPDITKRCSLILHRALNLKY